MAAQSSPRLGGIVTPAPSGACAEDGAGYRLIPDTDAPPEHDELPPERM